MKYIWVKLSENIDEFLFVKKPPRNNRSPSAPNFTFSETNGKKQKENYQKFWMDKCVWKGMYISAMKQNKNKWKTFFITNE